MSTPLRISRTVSSSSVSTITWPLVREPDIVYVDAEVIVTLLPTTVVPPGGLTVIEFPLKVMVTTEEGSQT